MSDSGKTDDKFDDFVQREARAYNAPPEIVPREEMWEAIAHAREASGGRRRLAGYAWIGVAATLLVGVAIGKYAFGTRATQFVRAGEFVGADTAATTYQVAANEHLARAEALLTAFGTSRPDVASDAQLAAWAKEVLSNTRLLLDSPAARDPSRRQLLEDLELVLVQIVQRSPPDGRSQERAHITRTLERTHVLSRLRSSLPNGPTGGN